MCLCVLARSFVVVVCACVHFVDVYVNEWCSFCTCTLCTCVVCIHCIVLSSLSYVIHLVVKTWA